MLQRIKNFVEDSNVLEKEYDEYIIDPTVSLDDRWAVFEAAPFKKKDGFYFSHTAFDVDTHLATLNRHETYDAFDIIEFFSDRKEEYDDFDYQLNKLKEEILQSGETEWEYDW